MRARFVNFRQFSHTRREIRLPYSLLTDARFSGMEDKAKAHAICLLILSARSAGVLPWNPAYLAKAIGATEYIDLEALEKCGFIERIEDEADPVADKVSRYIPDEVRVAVFIRDQGRCVKCRRDADLEFDHVLPVSRGGESIEANVQLLCKQCNRRKSGKYNSARL